MKVIVDADYIHNLPESQVGVKPMNLLQQVRFINFIKRKGIKTQNTNRALINYKVGENIYDN